MSAFVVLGQQGVQLEQNDVVVSGHVGANVAASGPYLGDNSEVSIGVSVTFSSPASRVMGDSVYLKQGAQVYDVYFNERAGLGQILGNQFTPVTLPLVSAFPTVPGFTAGTQNINVGTNGSLTLAAGSYGNLTSQSGATITFTGGVYTFASWDMGVSNKLYFAAPSEIRIVGKLNTSQNSIIGPAPTATTVRANNILIYVTGQNGNNGNLGSTPKAAQIGTDNTLTASIYAPNGTLLVKQNSVVRGALLGKWVNVGVGVSLTLESGW